MARGGREVKLVQGGIGRNPPHPGAKTPRGIEPGAAAIRAPEGVNQGILRRRGIARDAENPPVDFSLELPEQRFESGLVALHESLEQFPVHGIGHRLPYLLPVAARGFRDFILAAGCGMLCVGGGRGFHMRQIAALTALLWIIVPVTAAGQDAKTVIEKRRKR